MELSKLLPWFLGALLTAALAVYIYGLNLVSRWRFRHLPGPKPRWLVGNLFDFTKDGIHKQRLSWQREYGPIFVFWFGRRPAVSVSDPEAARKIVLQLNDKDTQRLVNPLTAPLLLQINSWFLSAADAKLLRSAWQPIFHSNNLASYASHMRDGADRLARRLEKAAEEGVEVNMWRLLGDLTMDVVGTTAFGVDFKTQADESTDGSGTDPSTSFSAAAAYVFKVGLAPNKTIKNPFILLSLFFPFLLSAVKPLEQLWRKAGLLDKEIKEYEAAGDMVCSRSIALTGAAKKDVSSVGPKTEMPAVGSFLHQLASSDKKLSDSQVAAQAYTFMLAGYETTANTLTFAMYLIANNEEVYEKAAAEVDAFGPAEPEFKQLSSFPYIGAIVDETLRLYPPVSATIPRLVDKEIELCGYTIPPGVGIVANIQAQHLDAANFTDPDAFRPERFLKDSPAYEKPHPYAYIPFGGGARACIGERFAVEEMKLTLVTILRRFRFELSPGQVPLRMGKGVTQSPEEGVYGRIHRRH
eukprot:CAMPEP_0177795416 /NCGR_PEP_ID=MMETSP0491_2-20121128/26220_1 /TAXON_ID=63592 /ORGANISM="Tetraselmis chuii, Strain PLY429" /LENGTH=524 /DNA_ID=CAMNT_0019318243 /DNA_START=73 /DNA_END=1647 /DNA_ORIENTATION=+